MISSRTPGKSFLNEAVYRDKVLGCWISAACQLRTTTSTSSWPGSRP